MAVLALHPPSPARPHARVAPWLIAAAVVWGGLALSALLGPFTSSPLSWRFLCFTATSLTVCVLFEAAARRIDLSPPLRLVFRINAAAFGLTACSYLYDALAMLGWFTPLPAAASAVVTLSTYGIAVVGLLYWPRAPLSRARWWHFGLDATIGAAGMSLFLVVLATLPGTHPSVGANERLTVQTYGLAQLLDLIALNVVMIRGLPLPSRRAFWTFMTALVLEIVSLVLIQYFTAVLPPGATSKYDDALYIIVQLLYAWSGILFLYDPLRQPETSLLPSWMLTFNPLPLLAIAGVGALLVSESMAGHPEMVRTLAIGLVLLVVLLVLRLMATVWENVRLVRQGAALQAEKLEALRRIAGGISHEFNNMLTAVIGHADLGLSEVEPASRVGHDLQGIRAAAERAAHLTHQLLAFSGRQFTGLAPLDLAAELRALAPRLREAAGPRVTVVLELPASPARTLGDAAQLGEFVLTLARRAERGMPGGGTLRLELAEVELEGPLTDATLMVGAGAYILLSVGDTGSAIPPELLAHLFEPYFPAGSNSRVPELGLAALHGIAAVHGAGLRVQAVQPHGTVFSLYLPRLTA
jgi:signal transduction histidine kinase